LESDQQYAQRQIRQFKTDAVSQIVASGLGNSKLLVSRVQRDMPDHGFATPTRPDSVFSVLVQLRKQDRRELYLDDKLVHQGSFPQRTVSVVNHWQRPKANLLSAFDTIIFTVPQSALNEIAEEQGVRPVETLVCENEGRLDDTIWNLAQSLIPALEHPEEVGSMYAERVLLASTTYFAHAFGGMRPATGKGHGLSARQVNWAIDLMHDQFQTDLSLSVLASEMDLTARQFAQAFGRTTGRTPDNWMRNHRIEQSKTMMRYSAMPIAGIATLCGFASPEHFARVFSSLVGVTPGEWRRQIRN
jgi:AraC-like DNA-binding protein